MRRLAGWVACLLWSVALGPQAATPIDFQREIRPILSDNCFACHGPDPGTRMAGLRLDLREAATEKRKNGAAIVPGDAAGSLLIRRIKEKRPALRMPPPQAHKTLSAGQIELLERWINAGAEWKEHWAFQPVQNPPLPAVKNSAWPRNAIDAFILARLEAAGLAPSRPADARTLIRRVALDLTGLPPTPAEIAAFLNDRAPGAYERMVDRYLASPRYGEHRARYWLDAARYADTHGIHIDNYREMWPYRDWVIQAFNRNMPFDQFTIEQLAGDLLPNPTLEQRIATGFHRCGPTTNEAGIIEEEYAEIYAKDRAETTGAVWMGLTVGCATCHDHKFDPIRQKDFYALGAFFRNTTQPVMDGNVPDTPPVLLVPRPEDRERWMRVTEKRKALRARMEEARRQPAAGFEQWLGQSRGGAVASPLGAGEEWFAADLGKLAAGKELVRWEESNVAGRKALFFRDNQGIAVAKAPQLDPDRPFSVSVAFFFPSHEQGYTLAARTEAKKKNRGWRIGVGARVVNFSLRGEDGKSIDISAAFTEQLRHGTWNHVVVTYDGSRHQTGLGMYLNGRAIPTQGRGSLNVNLRGEIKSRVPLMLGGALKDGAIADFRIFRRVLNEQEAYLLSRWPEIEAALARGADSSANRELLLTYYLFQKDEAFRELVKEDTALEVEARAIARRGAVTHVMQERVNEAPAAHVLFRGAYDQKREKVGAAVPAVLPPLPEELPQNRLGFAQWLFRAENPLTARVTVNRMWQEVFGTGLVKTADDFGSQGEPPSHPELLDWLATDFRESRWDVKRFYKQLLMSATYQQSAAASPEQLEKDPENRLLSRGPRFRMDGEMVRDYVLAVSGLLSGTIGGPSVKPYQPDGVWEAVAMESSNTRFYKRDAGESLYRRSLYTFHKRSAPPASMEIFNAPTREMCTVRRERTNTPLQALVTMNDEQFVEAARVLAERAYLAAPDWEGRLAYLSEHALGRPLEAAEREIAQAAYRDYLRYYDSKVSEARKLVAVGEWPVPRRVEPAVHAALTMLANQLLNLDEVLNK